MKREQTFVSNDNPVTKFIDLDPQPIQSPTRFAYVLHESGEWVNINASPRDYRFVELIAKSFTGSQDLMFAYNDPQARGDGSLFLGNWNGGCL